MKNEFKKNDWLLVDDNEIVQFIGYDDNGWCDVKIPSVLSYEVTRKYQLDDLKLWQPKLGDICIFWNTDNEYIIAKFDGIYQSTMKTLYLSKPIAKSNLITTMFKYCIPFVGVLPTTSEV